MHVPAYENYWYAILSLFLGVKKLLRAFLLARNGAGIVRNARNKSGIFSPENLISSPD
jgi:hypothetical protein